MHFKKDGGGCGADDASEDLIKWTVELEAGRRSSEVFTVSEKS